MFQFPRSFTLLGLVALVASAVGGSTSDAADQIGPDPKQYQAVVNKAIHYLQAKGQAEDGSYSAKAGPGVTALVTTGLLKTGRGVNDPQVAKALKYLEGFVRKDGGVYAPQSMYRNYETSIALMCFAAANRDGRYDQLIKGADAFLKGLQVDESGGKDPSDPAYGGAGYGKHKRPDLSNTAIFLDALVAAGNGPDDEAIQRAKIFVSRCQNLETVHNTTKWSARNPDGGFYYTAAAGGESQAKWPEGESEEARGLRSYGSMTYAGLKSLIYAGLGPSDPRVQAATKWLRKYYSVEENPGLGKQGLFYYYHTLAKTLGVLGEDRFEDAKGVKHDWRRELTEKLAALQNEDGSWVNQADRWMEGDPNLVTGYALLALSYCRPKNP